MKLYNPKKFQKLYEYKENIQDEEVKEIIEELIKNYNRIYIKLKDIIFKQEDMKELYNKIDKLTIENKELKGKVDRYKRIIKEYES